MLYELTLPASTVQSLHQTATTSCISPVQQKDYSRPLHVDCSVEYELPSQVKPPPPTNGKIDPLLMIHPCYFRKIEAQRRSPFINNLPGRGVSTAAAVSSNSTTTNVSNNINLASNRCTTNRIISGQTNSNSNQHPAVATAVCRTNNNNIVKNQQTIQQQQQQQQQQQYHPTATQIPHYQMPNNVRHQQHGWPTEAQQQPSNQHYSKQAATLSTAVGTSKSQQQPTHHLHHHQLPSCAAMATTNALYNASTGIEGGGLWTNTNHSPLAAERFPEPPQMTLHHQIQPTITTADNSATATTSCSKNHILTTGKYRQYLRTHRLHPYMSMATTAFPQFPQMQQISCYNV